MQVQMRFSEDSDKFQNETKHMHEVDFAILVTALVAK